MTRKEKYMELGQLLKEIPNKDSHVVLIARYLDKNGLASDFYYHGCAVKVRTLEKCLPYAIKDKIVMHNFTNGDYGTDIDGKIVEVVSTIVIEF